MSFMDRALGEELWEAEVQIREDCLTLGIRVQATATQGHFVQHDANACNVAHAWFVVLELTSQ